MTLSRYAAAAAAVGLIGWLAVASPSRAQDYPFQGLAAMDAMSSLRGSILDLEANRRDAEGAEGTSSRREAQPRRAAPSSLGFRRDPAVTQRVHADLVQRVARTQPEAARALAQQLSQRDPLTAATPGLRRFGLDTGDAVDAIAIYFLAMWGVANNHKPVMTMAQAHGARAHVARSVDFAALGLDAPAARQHFAESLIYQGLLMDAAIEQAQTRGDERLQKTLSDAAQGQMMRMGLDMRRLALTRAGFIQR